MGSIGDIFLRLVLDDSAFEKSVVRQGEKAGARAGQSMGASLAANLSRSATGIGKSLANIGQGLTSAGRGLTMGLTLPLVAAGGATAKLASDFEATMSTIVGLVGVSSEQVDQWSKDLIELGPKVGKSPQQLAEALFFVTSAGFRGSEAIDVLTASAKASAAGLGDVAVIADAVTSAVNAYGPEVLSASRATDVLTAAVREGKLEASSLAPVLGRLLPTASAMGVSFDQVAASLAVMSRTGLGAEEASTSLSSILSAMLKPTKQAADALGGVGLSLSDLRTLAAKEPDGLVQVMRLLDEAFQGNDEALTQVIPNVRAFRGVMNVLAQDSSVVDSVFGSINGTIGDTDKAFEEASQTAKFKMDAALSDLQGTAITLGADVLPIVVEVLHGLADGARSVAEWWRSLDDGTRSAIVRFLAFAAAAGPVLLVTGKLVGALGALFKAVGFLAGAGGIPRLIGVLRTLSLMKLGVIGAIVAIGAAMIYGINAAHDWVFELTHGKKALKDLQALAAQGLNDKVANEIIEMGVSLEDWSRLVDAAEGDTDAAFKAIADHAGDVGGAMADLVRQTEDEGASWDRAMLGYAKGAQDAKTAIVDSAEEIPPAYAAVLADGRLQVEQAAQDGIEDPIKKAMEKAVEEAGKAAQDALNRIESIFAKGPDQLKEELKALREALKNPYTELERTADLNVYLANKAIIDGLKSGDPLIEKAAFSQVNSWLEQWQDLTGGAYDAGRGVNPAFTDGAGSNLDEAIRYLQQNNIIPIVDLYQLADVLDAAGYDALAAYARGQARADLDRGIAVRTGIVRDIKSTLGTSLWEEGYNTGRTYAQGLDSSWASWIKPKAEQIRRGVQGFLEFSGSPPYTHSREAGEGVGRSWITALTEAIRQGTGDVLASTGDLLAGSGLGAYPAAALAPATPSLSGVTSGAAGPVVNNYYNLAYTGRKDKAEVVDIFEELQRMGRLP